MYCIPSLLLKFSFHCSGFMFIILSNSILAYNLDINNFKIFSVPKSLNHKHGNYFGFSVAFYSNGKNSVLLVGAPRANSSIIRDVIEPGIIYQCPINDTCKEWIIKNTNSWRKQIPANIKPNEDNAWIGATIAVENKAKPKIVVCGPRWKYKKNGIANEKEWIMSGICYWTIVKNTESFNRTVDNTQLTFMSLKILNSYTNIIKFQMAQLGFSLHVTSNGLVLGSPGVDYSNGISILEMKLPGKTALIIPFLKSNLEIQYYNYFGYAVTSGYYFKKGELWFASSAPKAMNMQGSVIIYRFPDQTNMPLIVKSVVSGEQYGEYYGAALTSCDINGDGKDELIVGAPQWTKDMDEGRVYIFTASHNEVFEKKLFEGEIPGGRFGSVVTCLGDIDYDGFADIAVGAPYEEQSGAIYIFNGNSNGLKHYSQKIIGTQFGQDVRGFGISISEPHDVNGDTYPDIAVGAYLSEQTILIKSKPVVTITTRLIYTGKKKLLRNSTFFIQRCTSYSGINVPLQLQIITSLKIDEMYGRAYYSIDKSTDNSYKLSDTLFASETSCSQLKINLKENIQNVIDPLEISISVSLKQDLQSKNNKISSNIFCTSCAIMNKFLSKSEDLIRLPFTLDCGEDNICLSDVRITLSTNLKFDNRYIIGSASIIKFIINTSNRGEPAYQAKIYVYIPEILSLASVPPSCMESSHINNTLEVVCDVGNPLKKDKALVLELDMSKVNFDTHYVKLWTNFTTQSEEKNLLPKIHDLTIWFDTDADIAIIGKAHSYSYSYILHDKDEEKQLSRLQFKHIYEVQKFGVSPIEKIILTVSIPTYWKYSTGDIQIINIHQTIGYLDGQQLYCTPLDFIPSKFLTNIIKNYSTHSELNTREEFSTKIDFLVNLPPENRTVYINCTNDNVKCTHIKCELSSFINSLSVAKLLFILEIYLSNFESNMIEGKDIFFVSNGSVSIAQSYNTTQKLGHKPHTTIVTTMFLGSLVTERLSTRIIVLSIFLGITLLMLLVLCLIKIGFFNRKKKEELQTLKSEANQENRII